MIFDIVEYNIMKWTIPNESRIYRRVLILKKKEKSVAGQFDAVKQDPPADVLSVTVRAGW